jgi:hypothetical protein|tara:strand:- start:41557 stop:41862 length:306 start_codon:yes stop_codon:yes gene_type:complete
MSDLVKVLKTYNAKQITTLEMRQAADRIEQLERENAELRYNVTEMSKLCLTNAEVAEVRASAVENAVNYLLDNMSKNDDRSDNVDMMMGYAQQIRNGKDGE